MPKVSVIMPAYNAEKYIREAIDSILDQTFRDFEFIIINDCSTDRTEDIILSYDDPRIIYLKNEKNLGVAETLNRGIEIARGEYIARMDADDISLPERFEKQVRFLEFNQDVSVVGSAVQVFGDGIDNRFLYYPESKNWAKMMLLFSPCFAHPSVMIRMDVFSINRLNYSREWEGTEDYALWWEIAKERELCSLKDVLLKYRIHQNQVTSNSISRRDSVFLPFAMKRLIDLDINVEKNDAELLFAYTNGNFNAGDWNSIKAFIRLVSKITRSSVSKRLYNHIALKVYLAMTVCEVFDLHKYHLIRRCYLYIFSEILGIPVILWRLKQLLSSIIRRGR